MTALNKVTDQFASLEKFMANRKVYKDNRERRLELSHHLLTNVPVVKGLWEDLEELCKEIKSDYSNDNYDVEASFDMEIAFSSSMGYNLEVHLITSFEDYYLTVPITGGYKKFIPLMERKAKWFLSMVKKDINYQSKYQIRDEY